MEGVWEPWSDLTGSVDPVHSGLYSPPGAPYLEAWLPRRLGSLAEGYKVKLSCVHTSCSPQGPSRNLLLNGKSYPTKVRLIRGGSLPPVKRRRMNWIDAPDDVFYMATEETRLEPFLGQDGMGVFSCHLLVFTGLPLPSLRKIRKLLSSSETKRAARRPYKPIALRQSQALPLRPPPPAPVNDEPIVIED